MTMRVYFSEGSDPMITDSVDGLHSLAAKTGDFLNSHDERLVLQADTSGSPSPYDALLPRVELEKSHGPIFVSLSSQKGLCIVGSPENLRVWCNHFVFPSSAVDGDHHHPDQVHRSEYVASGSMPVIIQVRDED